MSQKEFNDGAEIPADVLKDALAISDRLQAEADDQFTKFLTDAVGELLQDTALVEEMKKMAEEINKALPANLQALTKQLEADMERLKTEGKSIKDDAAVMERFMALQNDPEYQRVTQEIMGGLLEGIFGKEEPAEKTEAAPAKAPKGPSMA